MSTTYDLRLLHGTDEPVAEPQALRAGPVRMLLDGIDLRYASVGRTELVRRVYVAVRDRNWNTIRGEVTGLEIDARDDTFDVRFAVRHVSHDIDFRWDGAITGEASGRIEYRLAGVAGRDLQYNRIGICVHHPWRETAGAPFAARTPDGEVEGVFPDLIGPQLVEDGLIRALFPAFDRLDLALPAGGSATFEFEGDLWETEDHRNWTDANFKTYSTPLSLGFPHDLAAGERLAQRVSVTPHGVAGAAAGGDGPVRLTIGEPTGTAVPEIGLGVDSDGHAPSEHELELLRRLAPAHFRVEVKLDGDDWRDELGRAQDVAERVGARLLVSLHLRPEHAGALTAVREALAGGPPVDYVLVICLGGRTSTPLETTPPGLVDLVRAELGPALPRAAIGGGTEIYFTEINRTRPQADAWDVVCFSITPQIHAFTDLDIVENLDAQAENVRSANALAPGKGIVVSPITIRRRVNFHAAVPDSEPAPGELPDSVDVRQPSLLGAAWTAGSLKYMCESGPVAVTYYESTGWRGVVERDEGSLLPELFHSQPGEPFPLYQPLAHVIRWCGAEVLRVDSDDPLASVALAVRTGGGVAVLVANLTPRTQTVVVAPVGGAELSLELEPYEVRRVEGV